MLGRYGRRPGDRIGPKRRSGYGLGVRYHVLNRKPVRGRPRIGSRWRKLLDRGHGPDQGRLRRGLDRDCSPQARLRGRGFFGRGSLEGRLWDIPGTLFADCRTCFAWGSRCAWTSSSAKAKTKAHKASVPSETNILATRGPSRLAIPCECPIDKSFGAPITPLMATLRGSSPPLPSTSY